MAALRYMSSSLSHEVPWGVQGNLWPHQRLVFYTSQCSVVALGEGECVLFIGTLLETLALDLHCLRNASRSARNTSGDMPSLTTCCLHFPRTPHTSLCLPSNKLPPPEALLFEAIF